MPGLSEVPEPAPSAPMAWRTRTAVFLLGLGALLNLYSTQPLLPELARDLGVPATRSAWTISATALGVAVVAPFAGAVSDRLGRKRVMLAAIAAAVLATLACAAAGSFESLLVLRFVQGLLVPFVFAVAVAYVAEEHTGPVAAAGNALYVAGTAFGGFCGRFLSGAVTAHLGWRSSFLVLALVLALTLAAVAAWLPRERGFARSRSLLAGLRGVGRHLRNASLLGTCLVGATILFLQVGSLTYAALHLQAPPFGLGTAEVGAVFAVPLVAVVVTPLTGRLIGRAGRLAVFAAASLVSVAGLGLTLVPATPAVVAGLAASSTGVFSSQACATGHAAAAAGSSRSGAVGLYLTCYYAGGGVGAVAPAPVYASAGWGGCVVLLAAVAAASVVVALLAWPAGAGRR
ncbi:MFS transporter [Quadrisphaera sp. DSM 44207]|uniref:MFS transporter n=1 Tax=Quadrisphaera sp. DSM 44207 TaxID=1881057 RepID=UPI000880AE73|nr:MFS transporter [Quadrisphaera sp. DSM 44207]SDQ70678.1 Predicted arabinose efflux permease, MFS family [Quadrisphaera sp. DSM 44207]